MAQARLIEIRQLVRFLTKSPSQALLTDAFIDDNINRVVLYDFPNELKLFDLRTQFTFTVQPYVDTYKTDKSMSPAWPLYNFRNRYVNVTPPFYSAGYLMGYAQSREQFFGSWPKVDSIQKQQQGDGTTFSWSGFVTNNGPNPGNNNQGTFILQNEVLFDSVDVNNNGLQLIDQPILDSVTRLPTQFGRLYNPQLPVPAPLVLIAPYDNVVINPTFPTTNFINYFSGKYTLTFATAPKIGQAVNSQVYFYVPSRPLSILFYDNIFTVRPVPDQPYEINFDCYKVPTELIAGTDEPEIAQWWQIWAYGAAIKILQQRSDYDQVTLITPEFERQKDLALYRTVVQNTTQRVATIYSNQNDLGSGWGNWNGYGQSGV